MSTAQAEFLPTARLRRPRVSFAGAFWNLFVKEIRESRSAMIVGTFAFWLVPVFLGLMVRVFSSGREDAAQVFGAMVYALLLSGGWLFAAAFGAHIVCRDWGRSEERFLLAQPVTPRWVVAAKLAAAIVVVGLIVLALLGVVQLLMLSTVEPAHREDLGVPEALLLCLIGVSLALSFSIAVITRQTTASLVLTMLIVVLGIAAPLVSGLFSFLHPNWDMLEELKKRGMSGRGVSLLDWWGAYGSFVLGVAVCIIGSLAAAFILCTRERVIHIGHKPLAWAVAIAALLLFGAGMMEVGQSADVCDRVVLWSQTQPGYSVMHCEGNRGYAVCAWGDHKAMHLQVADFAIDPDGRVDSLRSSEVVPAAVAITAGPAGEICPVPYWISEVKSGGKDAFTIVGTVSSARLLTGNGLCRLNLRWDGKAGFQAVAASIAGEAAEPNEAEDVYRLYSKAWTDRYAYLLYTEEPKESPDYRDAEDRSTPTRRCILRVYEWSTGPRAARVLELPIPFRCSLRHADSQIIFYDSGLSAFLGAVSSDDLQAVKDFFMKGPPKPRPLSAEEKEQLSRARSRSEWYHGLSFRRDRVSYELHTDGNGLRAQCIEPGRVSESVRSYRCSILAKMMRFGGGLRALDSTLLAQEGSRELIFYDMSDPCRIRRVSFYNTVSGYPVQLEEADGYLLVLEQGDLTVLKRPRTARPGSPMFSWQAPAAGAG